jgi:hypothetical protein
VLKLSPLDSAASHAGGVFLMRCGDDVAACALQRQRRSIACDADAVTAGAAHFVQRNTTRLAASGRAERKLLPAEIAN